MKKILKELTVNHDIQKMNLYLNRCGYAGNFFTIYIHLSYLIHLVSKKICQNSIKNILISETNNPVRTRFGKTSYCKQLLERNTHTHTHTHTHTIC